MRDDDRSRTLEQQLLDARDAVDVEVVRRLVEQEQLGLQRQRQGQRAALALAAGQGRRIHRPVEAKAVQELDQTRFGAPAIPLVGDVLEMAALREALAQRRGGRQLGFLLDEHDREAVARLELAVVELSEPRDYAQERGFPAAVPADQADAIALEDGERRPVEEREIAVRELRGGEGGERQSVTRLRAARPRTPASRSAG